jgi:hypothetical protein
MPTDPASIDQNLEGLTDRAVKDLSGRLSVPLDQIEVLEAKAVVWPDASAGCPRPGMRYKQVPLEGALILLRVGDRVYRYHSGGGRGLFLCEARDLGRGGASV